MVALILSGLCTSPALSQLPLFPTSEPQHSTSALGWNINEMYDCGNILCSPVYVDGNFLFSVTSLPENQLNSGDQYILSAEERSKNIQNTLYRIINSKQIYDLEQKAADETYTSSSIKIEVGELFGQTVVFLPDQEGLVSRKIVTITELDARYAEKQISNLAEEWKNKIQKQLQDSISEREELYQTPFQPLKTVGRRLLWIIFISLSIYVIYRLIKAWDRKLRRTLQELDNNLAFNAESASSENLTSLSSEGETSSSDSLPQNLALIVKGNIKLPEFWKQLNNTTNQLESILQILPQLLIKRRTFLKQQRNLLNLILQLLLTVQFLIWSWGGAALVNVYPQTRNYQHFFWELSLSLPLVWVLIIVFNKLGDFLIEWSLSRWARYSSRQESSSSSRYALRANTYSTALTQLTSFIFITLGILMTLRLLGFSPTILASFGVIAVTLSWFSQNTVQDLLNGALILWNDRYAVGDVVDINGVGGLVEKLNLYMTQLRNLDGEAITIPNGSVDIVRNMTKDWSRVNFSVVIAYDADLNRAMELIEETASAMRKEPAWEHIITDDLQMLGVDELSHQGVLIRALIRTQPIKQWDVAREFRRRLKLVFEKEGIGIGVPQQSVRLKDYSPLVSLGSEPMK
ncbi:mechanosensitive ion channel family protein [Roseofilum capinflatum]|uniref:Mechanosensitive ion channel family protein n=1 Tax=Roseofilum capinflatum BLCC-M114 TaxID=3022440 RepID=A0ABT7B771_9CYAN|nr:mechanosensitive ion channel family protein [Roseofilum capinflatum]MDJ1174950.1 mechanosensitive ion channel family protein [Roseofilum capinflatum BLCC-M114]